MDVEFGPTAAGQLAQRQISMAEATEVVKHPTDTEPGGKYQYHSSALPDGRTLRARLLKDTLYVVSVYAN